MLKALGSGLLIVALFVSALGCPSKQTTVTSARVSSAVELARLAALPASTPAASEAVPNTKAPGTPGTEGQDVVKEKAYELLLPKGWMRTTKLPEGFDAGFKKVLEDGQEANLCFHHEIMPPELGEPPSDTTDMAHQFDVMVRNQYSEVKSLPAAKPEVQGRILVNSAYTLNDGGAVAQRRYTYFLAGRTAFVVQCTAPPARWAAVQDEFDDMLVSLRPGDTTAKSTSIADDEVVEQLNKRVPVLVSSWPVAWDCSVQAIEIFCDAIGGQRELDITLAFQRSDVRRVYDATKQLFAMIKAGQDEELNKLPRDVQAAAASSGEFINYIGQVCGYAYSQALDCDPPIERYRINVTDSSGAQIGSIAVSKENLSAILTGEVTAADSQRIASTYEFD